jgi:hypothetical protein
MQTTNLNRIARGDVSELVPLPTTHRSITPATADAVAKPRGGLKKVSFGAVAKPKDTKTAYPVLPDENGQAGEIAARIIERQEQFEALEGALKTDKAELKQICTPFYFEVNRSRREIPSSIAVNSLNGEVLVTFQNRYSLLPDEAGVVTIIGDGDLLGKCFRQSFEVKIKSDKLADDKQQEFIERLQALAVELGCMDAIEVKEGVKPTKEFHEARHTDLTVEQNLQLEQACPIIAQIKTKGRRV